MNTKPIPVILALIACLISCVISILEGVSFALFVKRFAITAVVFLVLGFVITIFLNKGFQVEQEELKKEESQEQNGDGSEEDISSESEENEK